MFDESGILFRRHPDPMWVYDAETLAFLEVNDAAIDRYGWSREDFLRMRISDIRPAEDRPALRARTRALPGARSAGRIWRHRLASGEVIHVEISSQRIDFAGRPAQLVMAREVTRLVRAERENAALLARERRGRESGEAEARRFRALFEAVPGRFLVLSPPGHEIVAVSDAYLEGADRSREEMLGRRLFDLLPEDPPGAEGGPAAELRASLERVFFNRIPDVMSLSPRPACPALGEASETRWWSLVNAPVLGPDGSVEHILHRVEDVTELVRAGALDSAAAQDPDSLTRLGLELQRELVSRSEALERANARLREQAADLRAVQRLLDIGFWSLETGTGRLQWSPEAAAIYGFPREDRQSDIGAYMAMIHPEDRPEAERRLAAFLASDGKRLRFAHRLLLCDGRVVHAEGAAERVEGPEGPRLSGVVQDVTERVRTAEALDSTSRILSIASRAAGLGGWRVELPGDRVFWTPETALLHETAPGWSPSVEEGLAFYAPEHRARVRRAFEACAAEGAPFDERAELITARGRRLQVRVIGEAVRDAAGAVVAVQGAFQDVTELVETRERSDALARRLHDALENMSDGFFILDRARRFSFVNARAARLMRRERDALEGRAIWELFPEAEGSRFQRECERALNGESGERFVERFDPLGIWASVSVHPAPDGVVVFIQDVSEAQARQERLTLLEAAVARINDIVLITDAEGLDAPGGPRILYVNKAFERITGFPRQEAVGRTPRMLHGPRTQRAALDRIRAALQAGRSVREELINYTRDGRPYWAEIDIAPMREADGGIHRFVAVQRDVSARKQAEEALRLSEERFQLVSRAARDVIWDWNLAEGTMWRSDTAAELYGCPVEEMGPDESFWRERLHPEDRERVLESLDAALAGTGDSWSAEYRVRRLDGGERAVVQRGFIQRDEAGRAVRLLGSTLDVTERRALDERLRRSQKLEAVGQLTGGVAHDFNNLLTVILGNAELLSLRLQDDPQLGRLAAMTESAAARGAELTSRLLAFARRQPLQPRPLDAGRQMEGMRDLLMRTLPANIDLRILAAPDLWRAEIDPGQLEVALLNLALNARDAMPGGGRLTLEADNAALDADGAEVEAGDYVRITVSDTGCGMDAAAAAQAFEPFFTTKEVGKGSGLGLSMVWGFAKQSAGHVRIYSEPGEGTAVRLYFPRLAGSAAPGEAEAEAQAESPEGGRERILVVEDEALVRGHVMAQLTSLGYAATGAASGPEALEILKEGAPFDLLFTDVVMPGGMSGPDVAEAAQAMRPGLKVLFTSGYAENAIIHDGRLDPGVRLLSKPYRLRELARKIREVLEGADAP